MQIKKGLGQIPDGVRDILPAEAVKKRELENSLAGLFGLWGYQEVITPTFEYYENLLPAGNNQEENMYKFLSRQGKIMALRPDMTTPIARLTASSYNKDDLPLRLFYLANVFKHQDLPQSGRQSEYYQAGAELLGLNSAESDAEIIALAVEALLQAGVRTFQISIGQVELFNGLMEELMLNQQQVAAVKQLISAKDFVGLEDMLYKFDVSQEDVLRVYKLLRLQGNFNILKQARQLVRSERTRAALDNLAEVYQILSYYQFSQYISLDLSVLRGFDYYTGIIFEGYSPVLGYSICGGGRYDNLLSKYGLNCPATGFAIGLERLLLVLEKENNRQAEAENVIDYLISYGPGNRLEALRQCQELRSHGYKTIAWEIAADAPLLLRFVTEHNIKNVINFN